MANQETIAKVIERVRAGDMWGAERLCDEVERLQAQVDELQLANTEEVQLRLVHGAAAERLRDELAAARKEVEGLWEFATKLTIQGHQDHRCRLAECDDGNCQQARKLGLVE